MAEEILQNHVERTPEEKNAMKERSESREYFALCEIQDAKKEVTELQDKIWNLVEPRFIKAMSHDVFGERYSDNPRDVFWDFSPLLFQFVDQVLHLNPEINKVEMQEIVTKFFQEQWVNPPLYLNAPWDDTLAPSNTLWHSPEKIDDFIAYFKTKFQPNLERWIIYGNKHMYETIAEVLPLYSDTENGWSNILNGDSFIIHYQIWKYVSEENSRRQSERIKDYILEKWNWNIPPEKIHIEVTYNPNLGDWERRIDFNLMDPRTIDLYESVSDFIVWNKSEIYLVDSSKSMQWKRWDAASNLIFPEWSKVYAFSSFHWGNKNEDWNVISEEYCPKGIDSFADIPGWNTPLYFSIMKGIEVANEWDSITIIWDGKNNMAIKWYSTQDILRAAQEKNITLHYIAIWESSQSLKDAVEETWGNTRFISDS